MEIRDGIILKILSIFESGLFIKILSLFITGLWIVGIILVNIYVIILALILLTALSMVLYIHRDNLNEIFQGDSSLIVEDERTQLINEKAATMTLGILTAVIIWVAIVILALRNSYPQYLFVGYTLFAVALFCFILYFSARTYYSRKY
jgi:uncharacterized membrane protein